jgi:hypothetical protein
LTGIELFLRWKAFRPDRAPIGGSPASSLSAPTQPSAASAPRKRSVLALSALAIALLLAAGAAAWHFVGRTFSKPTRTAPFAQTAVIRRRFAEQVNSTLCDGPPKRTLAGLLPARFFRMSTAM